MLPIELLEKYHIGELKPEEMQQIEKAMLQNPFLTETVEGIALSKEYDEKKSNKTSGKTFLEQVESIKQGMPYHQNDKKHSLITEQNKNKNSIYSLAAVILLLLTTGIALWFYSQNNLEKSAKLNDASATMAYQSRNEESSENTKNNSIPKVITADLRKEITTENTVEKLNNNAPKKPNKTNIPKIKNDENSNDKLIATNISKKTASISSVAPIIASKPQVEDAKEESETHNAAKGNTGQESDIAQESNLSDDVIERKTVSKPLPQIVNKASNKDSKADTEKNMEIIEDKSKSKRSNVILKEENRKKDMITTIEPEMGWENYQVYLSKNLDKSVANGKKGKVMIEVTINENGTIKESKILQSLCEACDIEAQRLVIEGGKWKFDSKIAQKELKKVIEVVF